jgi:inosine-uridine nucleoside N-ribohydrolase
MTKKEAVTLYMTMKTLIEPDVVNQFRAIFNQLNNDELYDVLFHIIAKGQDFYYACLEDPTFCLYLSSQYQPLATTLYKYILQ